MTAKKTKLIPAVARLDIKPRKPTKVQRMRQQRQIQAWQRAQNTSANPAARKETTQ